ncbi:MAG: acetylornithine deacetylase [Porticoccaceae bacterium]
MIKQLIACNSISSVVPAVDQGNLNVIHLLAGWLDDLGFATEIMPLPDPRKANLIATWGSGPGGLVLSGHSDTVPCDDSLWHSDPFTLSERDGRFYGLGSADMKSFFALAIEAFKPLARETFRQPLIILATADEETSMAGARALVEAGKPLARRALIGEPTTMKPIRMHKGIMVEKLVIEGHSGHSSNPAIGRNAMHTLHQVLGELLAIQAELKEKYRSPLFAVDYPSLNLGCIHGGDNPNRICGHCELGFEIRPLPGMNIGELQALLERRLLPLGDAPQTPVSLSYHAVPPFATDEDSELSRLCQRLSGSPASSVAFATEAPFLQQLGMDVMVMGPGNIDQAHQPNEYIALDQLDPAVAMIRQLIVESCINPGSLTNQ